MSTESDTENSIDPDDRTAAHQADIDKLVPGIEPGDYGKMPPSFHNNSQRIARSNLPTTDSPATEIEHESLERSIRPPIIPRDKYDGVDSDDETDEEDEETQDEDEDMPQLVGDVEIDMEEEQEEFLEFARQALGMSDGQWRDIIKDRESRGGE